MPIYANRNPWKVAASGGAATAGDAVGSVFETMQKAKLLQAQQQYQRRLLEAHTGLFQSQANLEHTKQEDLMQKMAHTKAITDLAGVVGQSQAARAALKTASLGSNPETLANAVTLLRSQNAAPQSGFNITPQDLDTLLSGLSHGSASTIAAESPTGAASLLDTTALPEGSVGYDKLGDITGMGQSKVERPVAMGVNGVYDPTTQKVISGPSKYQIIPGGGMAVNPSDPTDRISNPREYPTAIGNFVDQVFNPKSDLADIVPSNTKTNLAKVAASYAIKRMEAISSDGTKDKVGKIMGTDIGSSLAMPTTNEEYNAIPSGTRYKHPDGTIRTKP